MLKDLKKMTAKYHQNANVCIQGMLNDSKNLILEDEFCDNNNVVFCMGDLFQSKPSNYKCLYSGKLLTNGLIACWPSNLNQRADTVPKRKLFKFGQDGSYIKKETLLGPYPGKIYTPNRNEDDMYTFGVIIDKKDYNLIPINPQQTFLPLINSISFDLYDSCQCNFEKFLDKVLAPLNKNFCFYIPNSELNVEPISIDGIIFYNTIKRIKNGDELVSNYKQQYLAGLTERMVFPRWKIKLVKHKLLYYRIILEWYRLHLNHLNKDATIGQDQKQELEQKYLDQIIRATSKIIQLTNNSNLPDFIKNPSWISSKALQFKKILNSILL
jgi:hypothetical protein